MSKLSITVYSPESALRYPGRFLREMFRDVVFSRELAWRLFIRDFSARYRQSVLGYLWAFLPPIVGTFTFVLLNMSGVVNSGKISIPYPAYVMIGTLLWQVFADSINSPIKTVNAAKPILTKINFPREAILLSGVLQVFVDFLIRLVLLVAIFIYYRIVPPVSAPLAIVGVFAIFCLGFMIGLLLTPLSLLFSDVSQSIGLFLSFWMLFTPVVYALPDTGLLARLGAINPISPLIVTTRELLIADSISQGLPAVIVFFVTLILLFASWVLYRLAMPFLVERMGG
jgi:lipopolysaccharide transport system permease protein